VDATISSVGASEAAQAVELIRALRAKVDEMIHRLLARTLAVHLLLRATLTQERLKSLPLQTLQ
jgi:bisphosphoglycerate-dependent phosphoglycerate mutase